MVSCKLCRLTKRSAKSIDNNILFHSIPADVRIAEQWLNFLYTQLGKDKYQKIVTLKHIKICSMHFEKDCYTIGPKGRISLKPHSIPTIVKWTRKESPANRGQHNRAQSSCSAESDNTDVNYPMPTRNSTQLSLDVRKTYSDKDRFSMEPIDFERYVVNEPNDVTVEEIIVNSSDEPIQNLMYMNGIAYEWAYETINAARDESDIMVIEDSAQEYISSTNHSETGMIQNVSNTADEVVILDDQYEMSCTSSWNQNDFHVDTTNSELYDLIADDTASEDLDLHSYETLVNRSIEPIYISSDDETDDLPVMEQPSTMKRRLLDILKYKAEDNRHLNIYKEQSSGSQKKNEKLELLVSNLQADQLDAEVDQSITSCEEELDNSIKKFALDLYKISPDAYSFLRQRFSYILPHEKSFELFLKIGEASLHN